MKKRSPQISQTLSAKLPSNKIPQTASGELVNQEIGQAESDLLAAIEREQSAMNELIGLFTVLASKELLKKKLLEWTRDQELQA